MRKGDKVSKVKYKEGREQILVPNIGQDVGQARELLDDVLNEFEDKNEIQLQTERVKEIRELLG